MAGRGFLKSRLIKITSNEAKEPATSEEPPTPKPPISEEPPTPEKPPELATHSISHADEPKLPISVMSTQALISGGCQVVRGRRVNINVFIINCRN